MNRSQYIPAVLVLVVLLLAPVSGMAQEDSEARPGSGLQERHAAIHDSLREQYQALIERLENADLRPAQKRRIYNALTDRLANRHDMAHDRLRDAVRDRPSDRRPSSDARPSRPVRADIPVAPRTLARAVSPRR